MGRGLRKDYQELGILRSFSSVPIMALAGTSTTRVKKDIFSSLQLQESETDVVFKSPDGPNIFIQIKKRESADVEQYLLWLIEHIKDKGVSSKKCIIYCRSIDRSSGLFVTLKDSLGLSAYTNKIKKHENVMIEMYHKANHEESKERILKEFKNESSTICCIIATVAIGMGVDIKDVDLVVHIGCPKSVLSFWQEAGRCARDGRKVLALLYTTVSQWH